MMFRAEMGVSNKDLHSPYVSKGGNIPPKILSDAPSICRRHALYSSPRFESSIDGWTPGMEVPSESRVPSRMLRGIDSLSMEWSLNPLSCHQGQPWMEKTRTTRWSFE